MLSTSAMPRCASEPDRIILGFATMSGVGRCEVCGFWGRTRRNDVEWSLHSKELQHSRMPKKTAQSTPNSLAKKVKVELHKKIWSTKSKLKNERSTAGFRIISGFSIHRSNLAEAISTTHTLSSLPVFDSYAVSERGPAIRGNGYFPFSNIGSHLGMRLRFRYHGPVIRHRLPHSHRNRLLLGIL